GQLTSKAALMAHINLNNNQIPPNSSTARAIRDAAIGLQAPIATARKAPNAAFLTLYTRALVAEAPKVLRNHLVARLEWMIALAQTGHEEALDTFVRTLGDKDQTIWVKLWAARGITNIVQTPTGGFRELQGPAAVRAAKALIAFMDAEGLPWPA